VLRQVPTLNVDIDGKISLRGSESLVIFINGKPSGLTAQNREQILMQIPASNIDRIELITNPSAKYDAEGMSGIINIITKKNIADGFSGNTTAGIGTNHKYNGSFTSNYRTD
jgi:outer membrane receptor for ferrienterochelin and colicin